MADDPADEIFGDPKDSVDVVPPVDVVSVDHAEAGLEPPQVDPDDPPEAADESPGAAADEPAAADQVGEVERRLRVHGLFRMPDLTTGQSGVARTEQQPTQRLHAVYHDTEDLRLARWGITLSRREGGDTPGWHLKLPMAGADGGVRDDERRPLSAGDVGDVPEDLADLVMAVTRNAPLLSVAELVTERTPYVLLDADGAAFAELLDDTVSVLDGDHIAARFRELAIEARATDVSLDPVLRVLIAAGALPGGTPKSMTALGPVTQDARDVPPPPEAGPDDPAGWAVTAHIRRHVRALMDQDIRVRRDLPDSVHQMRVAARRLRSGLKAFSPLVDDKWSRWLRGELGWIAGELGASRDTEVLQERIDHHAEELGEKDARLIRALVDPELSRQWHEARSGALTAMRSQRYRDLLDGLVDAAVAPRLTGKAKRPCGDVLPRLVDKAWNKLDEDVSHLRLDGPSEPWHEARIMAKRARYAAEAVAPVMGEPVKRFAKSLSGVTEVLGEHQDAWVAQQTLQHLAAVEGVDGRTGFSLGLLHEFEFEQELFARADFTDLWPSVKRAQRKARLD